MSQILTPLISLLNVSLNKYVNTGDRNLDNSIILLITVTSSTIINYIFNQVNYKNLYNKLLYFMFYFFRDVNDPKNLPYNVEFEKGFIEDKNTKKQRQSFSLSEGKLFGEFIKTKKYLIFNQYHNDAEIYVIYVHNGNFVYCYFGGSATYLSTITFTLYSTNNTSLGIAFSKFMSEFENYKNNNSLIINKKIFSMMPDNSIKETGKISINKTFNTLYYDQKEELLNLLNKFKNNNMYPKCISMDNKLGILLHGPPGTGKTGTISAIANLLDRDVLVINFLEVTTCVQLDTILSETNRNKILVFDEFDCISDALVNPNKMSNQIDDTSKKWSELLLVAEGEERKEILKMAKEGKSPNKDTLINLGYLLYKLDGLEDNNNRIIIATTNNPEKINPTLLRPGRFDIKLCLHNCSKQMYRDIIGNFFNNFEFDVNSLPDRKYSPLEVINKCLVYNDLDKVLEELI